MKNIKTFWDDLELEIDKNAKFKWNEAELISVRLNYSNTIFWILNIKSEDLLLRNCIVWDSNIHNSEIINIYDEIESINNLYKQNNIPYNINIVPHFTDDLWNIFIKDLSTISSFNIYDLMPDWYYIDPSKKQKSRFKEFKNVVKELNINRSFIISKIFEQLAMLHANNFVVWKLSFEDKSVSHPTLSLFLYWINNSSKNIVQDIFIHDIHNLEKLSNPTSFDYISRISSDLKNMSFDIIRFFKWIWIPNVWFKKYSEVLKRLNPDLYKVIYTSFLRNPVIEIELWAIKTVKEQTDSEKNIKTAKKVIKHTKEIVEKKIESNFLNDENIFFLKKSKQYISNFLNTINPENTEFIIDFDGTITYSNSLNSLNCLSWWDLKIEDIDLSWFYIRKWFKAFLNILKFRWYTTKIYSMWYKELIKEALKYNWIEVYLKDIYWNSLNSDITYYNKEDILLDLDTSKRWVFIWDNISDFSFSRQWDLKIWFLNYNSKNPSKRIDFNNLLDCYYIDQNSHFANLYYQFRWI